jgi:hypothetical protein
VVVRVGEAVGNRKRDNMKKVKRLDNKKLILDPQRNSKVKGAFAAIYNTVEGWSNRMTGFSMVNHNRSLGRL